MIFFLGSCSSGAKLEGVKGATRGAAALALARASNWSDRVLTLGDEYLFNSTLRAVGCYVGYKYCFVCMLGERTAKHR